MAAAATQSYLDAQKVLESYKTSGVSASDSDAAIEDALNQLSRDRGGFANNVKEVGKWAIQIDEAFDRVTRGLSKLTEDFEGDFPQLAVYLGEWRGYNTVGDILIWADTRL